MNLWPALLWLLPPLVGLAFGMRDGLQVYGLGEVANGTELVWGSPGAHPDALLDRALRTGEGKGDEHCQYYAVEGLRPPGSVWNEAQEIEGVEGIGGCERACSNDQRCKGYVVRSPFKSEGQRQGMCWKIFDSNSWADMAVGGGDKNTYYKRSCGCGSRVLHLFRDEKAREELREARRELKRTEHDLGQLRVQEEVFENDKSTDPEALEEIDKSIREKQDHLMEVQQKLDKFRQIVEDFAEVEAFSGVYNWMGLEGLVPERIDFLTPIPGKFRGGKFTRFFNNLGKNTPLHIAALPLRLQNIYKHGTQQTFLYQCANRNNDEDFQWYVMTLDQVMEFVQEVLKLEKLPKVTDMHSIGMRNLLRLYKKARCIGMPLTRSYEGKLQLCAPSQKGELTCRGVDVAFTSDEDEAHGCFEATSQASKAFERSIIETGAVTCDTFALSNTKEQMQKVINILTKSRAWSTAISVGKWVAGWFWQPETQEGKKVWGMTREEMNGLLDRGILVLQQFQDLAAIIETLSHEEDEHVKIVCAGHMLEGVQKMGGIFPKIAQNLAVHRDIVQDDFARIKLKETQSENPTRPGPEVEEYIRKLDARISIQPEGTLMPLLDVLEFDKVLAAGSVGQVNRFRVRPEFRQRLWPADPPSPPAAEAGVALSATQGATSDPPAHDHVVVKTVFEETHFAYDKDWTMLGVIFEEAKEEIPPEAVQLWDLLRVVKDSVMDEFDLNIETEYTIEGRRIIKEFAERQDIKEKIPGVKFEVPRALNTTTQYVMLQSIAKGTTLKEHMANIQGQADQVARWRTHIFRGMNFLYGYMVLQKRFFMADPHGGNWFWDDATGELTLIDWGSVGRLGAEEACTLTSFYYHMSQLMPKHEECESFVLSLPKSKKGSQRSIAGDRIDFQGRYTRSGASFVMAEEPDDSMWNGFMLTPRYTSTKVVDGMEYSVSYDGGKWKLLSVNPGSPELYHPLLYLSEPSEQAHGAKTDVVPGLWTSTGQGRSIGFGRNKQVNVSRKECPDFNTVRTRQYAEAASFLGVKFWFKSTCQDYVFLESERLLCVQVSKYTGKQFVEFFRDSFSPVKLHLEVLGDEETFGLYVEVDGKKRALNYMRERALTEEEEAEFQSLSYVKRAFAPKVQLLGAQDERKISWDGFPAYTRLHLLRVGAQGLGIVAAGADSDIILTAIMATGAMDFMQLFELAGFPQDYALVARCIQAFGGILVDMLNMNQPPRLPLAYIEWFFDVRKDRWFKHWGGYTKETTKSPACSAERRGFDQLDTRMV